MGVIENIILGLVQGLTEFIPVSSSGHLVIFQNFLSGASNHLFLESINIGTTFALLVYFRKKIVTILNDIFINKNFRLTRNIIITSVPAGAIGYLAAGFIESSAFFTSVIVVAIMLAVVGVIMIVLEKLPRLTSVKSGENLSSARAAIIGGAQLIALIPGTSRSGSTIIAGRLSGLSPRAAAEYSFLASLPIMLGVTLKVLVNNQDYIIANLTSLILSNLVAFVFGLLAVGVLMRYLSHHSLAIFGWYRIGLATVIMGFILLQ